MNTSSRLHFLRRALPLAGIVLISLGQTTNYGSSTSSGSCSGMDGFFGKSSKAGNELQYSTHLIVRDATGDDTDSFQNGEEIRLVLTVRNRSDSTRTISFTTTTIADFVIVEENSDNVVFRASDATPPSDTPTDVTFQPGETKTYEATWNQVLSNGALARDGAYEARGALIYNDFGSRPLRLSETGSPTERFTIN